MIKTMRCLWNDEAGFVVSTELALVATLLVIGMVVGLDAIRVSVVQELGDVGGAIGGMNQSYTYTAITGHTAATAGADFFDHTDVCENGGSGDVVDAPPGCITFQDDHDEESEAVESNNGTGGAAGTTAQNLSESGD